MNIKFTVYGNPKGLKRHRDRKFGGKYDPSAGDKADFLAIAAMHRPLKPYDNETPITLQIRAYFKRPKKHFFTGKRSSVMRDDAPIYHTNTPDADNIVKFVGDALNGIFWEDDKSIAIVRCAKIYCDNQTPRLEIEIDV